ncbi:MerR family transcriptional regulator [Desulfothermus okinawensis JCM 13304]
MERLGRRYYKIGEVARVVGVEPYVLRFWEGEFTQIKTIRTKGGQRLYPRETVKIILKIKRLLYDQGMTIEGARKKLKEQERWNLFVKEIKDQLLEIKRILEY